MKLIPLTQGKFTKVDDEDFEYLNQWKWLAKESEKGAFYACRNSKREKGKKRLFIRMHNELMNPPIGLKVDHIDRDPLNNQKSNLRICTPAQNSANTRVRISKKSSKYLGVFISHNKWISAIKVNGKQVRLGRFPMTPEGEVLAAKAYNNAAKMYKGEFANLNDV